MDDEYVDFDDLFDMEDDDLVWLLRTRTAVGITTPVFETLGREPANKLSVLLVTINPAGRRRERQVRSTNWLPEELLDPGLVVDFNDLPDGAAAQRDALLGKALRYRARERRSGGRFVDVYFLVVDGRQMNDTLTRMEQEDGWKPSEWTGLWLATRGMPANVQLGGGLIKPRAYERRTFALFQYDDLRLDLGRKTVAGRPRHMLNNVAEKHWNLIADAAERVQRGDEDGAGRALLRQRLAKARRAANIRGPVPYIKVPHSAVGVTALFHELVATPASPLDGLHTLRTGVFEKLDELLYIATPNGADPHHVLFGFKAADVVKQLQEDDRLYETVKLAVVWQIGARPGVEVTEVDAPPATHELLLYKAIERLPVVVLNAVLDTDPA